MGQHRQHRAKLAGMEGDLGDAFSESNVHPVNGLRVDRVPDQEERKRQKQDQPQQYERSCRGGHQHACQPPHWHTGQARACELVDKAVGRNRLQHQSLSQSRYPEHPVAASFPASQPTSPADSASPWNIIKNTWISHDMNLRSRYHNQPRSNTRQTNQAVNADTPGPILKSRSVISGSESRDHSIELCAWAA
eukprot:3714032-Rhodomonas_salina.1